MPCDSFVAFVSGISVCVDVGYGCGDQDLYFWETFHPAVIVGITYEGTEFSLSAFLRWLILSSS